MRDCVHIRARLAKGQLCIAFSDVLAGNAVMTIGNIRERMLRTTRSLGRVLRRCSANSQRNVGCVRPAVVSLVQTLKVPPNYNDPINDEANDDWKLSQLMTRRMSQNTLDLPAPPPPAFSLILWL